MAIKDKAAIEASSEFLRDFFPILISAAKTIAITEAFNPLKKDSTRKTFPNWA